MHEPLSFTRPQKSDYAFLLEDGDKFAKRLPIITACHEYEHIYSSYSAARSAGKSAFCDEIYSQADIFAEKIVSMYKREKMNKIVIYSETDDNYKYNIHKKISNKLRFFVSEIEKYTGKNLSLPINFFVFQTQDTEYVRNTKNHPDSWISGRIKEYLEPVSDFYRVIKVDSTKTFVKIKHWFREDSQEWRKRYSFFLGKSAAKFNRRLGRAVYKALKKYASNFCEKELDLFYEEIIFAIILFICFSIVKHKHLTHGLKNMCLMH